MKKTQRKITFFVEAERSSRQVQNADAPSAPAYEAFSAMLRVNTSLRLEVPPFNDTVRDQRLVVSQPDAY
jgi:hypothetical protein